MSLWRLHLLRHRLSTGSSTTHTLSQVYWRFSLFFIPSWSRFATRCWSIPTVNSWPGLLDLWLELTCLIFYLLLSVESWNSHRILIPYSWLRRFLRFLLRENIFANVTESGIWAEINVDRLGSRASSFSTSWINTLFRTSKSWFINHIPDIHRIL